MPPNGRLLLASSSTTDTLTPAPNRGRGVLGCRISHPVTKLRLPPPRRSDGSRRRSSPSSRRLRSSAASFGSALLQSVAEAAMPMPCPYMGGPLTPPPPTSPGRLHWIWRIPPLRRGRPFASALLASWSLTTSPLRRLRGQFQTHRPIADDVDFAPSCQPSLLSLRFTATCLPPPTPC